MSKNRNNEEGFAKRAFDQFMELFVTPAIEKRQAEGGLPKSLRLHAAQIIFYPYGRSPSVRINNEIEAIAEVKLKSGVSKQKEEPIRESEVEGLQSIQVPEYEDCGHATLIRFGDSWSIAFDFRYNKTLSRRHIEVAQEFLEAAQDARARENWSPFVENLFAASELAARSILLSIPDPRFREKSSHRTVHKKFNRFASLGNVETEHRKAFNQLHEMRSPARYLKGMLSLRPYDADELLRRIRELVAFARSHLGD